MNDQTEDKPQESAQPRGSELNELLSYFKHLVGFHNCCCCVAGKWRLEDHKRVRHALCTRTNLPLIKRNIYRFWRYTFIRRLAITPYRTLNDYEKNNDKMIFEWQKMPAGYRWF